LTGQVGGQPFSVHAEGERVILTGAGGRQEIDLVPPAGGVVAAGQGADLPPTPPASAPASGQPEWPEPLCPAGVVDSRVGVADDADRAPGTSPLDEGWVKGSRPDEAAKGGDA
jgi:hypothetical protein